MDDTIVIAYKEKDKVIANQLRKLLETKDDTEDTVVGVKDRSVTVIPWEEKVWLDQESKGLVDSKVLLIDKVKGASSLAPIMDIKFQKHGVTYGWAGTQAVITVDEQALRKKEDYSAFLGELREIASASQITEYERGDAVKKDAKKAYLMILPVLKEFFAGKIIADAFKDAKMVRQQMLLYGVTHLYLNNLTAFLED